MARDLKGLTQIGFLLSHAALWQLREEKQGPPRGVLVETTRLCLQSVGGNPNQLDPTDLALLRGSLVALGWLVALGFKYRVVPA